MNGILFWAALAAFGAIGIMIMTIRLGAKKEGRLEAATESQEQVIEDIEQANRVSRAIESLPADEKRKLLGEKWAKH